MTDFILHIKNGKVANNVKAKEVFRSLSDGKYLVRIDSIKKRTLPQNAYYHAVVVPMVKEGLRNNGYNEVKTNQDAHDVLKELFLKRKMVSDKTGDEIPITGSTAGLRTVEFNAFLEDIWQWASQYLSLYIPHPNEQTVLFDKPMIAEYDFNNEITIVT